MMIETKFQSRIFGCAALFLFAVMNGGCKSEQQRTSSSPVRVAAAADLTPAFEELGGAFTQRTGERLTFSFGSTGLLAKQLREGAPFDVFAAANVSFVDDVVAAGACDGATKALYARGRIAVWTKKGGDTATLSALDQLASARFKRIAIANPDHAPYGQAAKQALQQVGIWNTIKDRLVLGENVRQTLRFAETGNVEAAVVALSLVINDRDNPWLLIDEALHRPMEQALVICIRGHNREGGRSFARFIDSETGRAVMRHYGFVLPGERLPQRQ